MELPYSETDERLLDTYRRVHANGEQTHIAILELADRYAAVAIDIDPANFQPLAGECVAYDPTLEGVRERARRWMEQHPKGILGDEDGSGGGRIVSAVMGLLKKMDEYGNRQVEQLDQGQGGQ